MLGRIVVHNLQKFKFRLNSKLKIEQPVSLAELRCKFANPAARKSGGRIGKSKIEFGIFSTYPLVDS